MPTKSLLSIAVLLVASATAHAADNAVQTDKAAGRTRAEVVAETEQALAAGAVRNGPLAEIYDELSPAPVERAALAQRTPVKEEGQGRIEIARAPADRASK